MTQVDKKTFYDSFNTLPGVTTAATGRPPFEWHVKQYGVLIAKSVSYYISLEDGEDYIITNYFIIKK